MTGCAACPTLADPVVSGGAFPWHSTQAIGRSFWEFAAQLVDGVTFVGGLAALAAGDCFSTVSSAAEIGDDKKMGRTFEQRFGRSLRDLEKAHGVVIRPVVVVRTADKAAVGSFLPTTHSNDGDDSVGRQCGNRDDDDARGEKPLVDGPPRLFVVMSRRRGRDGSENGCEEISRVYEFTSHGPLAARSGFFPVHEPRYVNNIVRAAEGNAAIAVDPVALPKALGAKTEMKSDDAFPDHHVVRHNLLTLADGVGRQDDDDNQHYPKESGEPSTSPSSSHSSRGEDSPASDPLLDKARLAAALIVMDDFASKRNSQRQPPSPSVEVPRRRSSPTQLGDVVHQTGQHFPPGRMSVAKRLFAPSARSVGHADVVLASDIVLATSFVPVVLPAFEFATALRRNDQRKQKQRQQDPAHLLADAGGWWRDNDDDHSQIHDAEAPSPFLLSSTPPPLPPPTSDSHAAAASDEDEAHLRDEGVGFESFIAVLSAELNPSDGCSS